MSFVNDRPAAQITDLSPGNMKILRMIRDNRVVRVKHGWRAVGHPLIKAETARKLAATYLVQQRNYNGVLRLETTALANTLLTIAEERRKK